MTRKLTRNTSVLRGIAPFIAVLTVMIALAALAQARAGQSFGKQHVRFASRGADNVEGVSPGQFRARQRDPQMPDSPPPLAFLPPAIYTSGGLIATSVAVADLNGDRKPDLVVANCSPTGSPNCAGEGSVAVFLGNGDGTFQPAATYDSGGGNTESVAVADVNGDGKPDLLVANEGSNTVGVLLGNGDGTFQTVVTYGSGEGLPLSIAVADVNGDHKPDLVVANDASETVGVLLGNGDGTFQTAVSYGSGGQCPSSVAVGDVNGDGKLDLVVANLCSGSVGVLLGNGDGTFPTAVSYGSGGTFPTSVAVADVNGDGKPDLVVANCDASGGSSCVDESVDGSVGVLLGNGDGSFQAAVAYDSGGSGAVSVAVADVNGDGKPDSLVANFCGTGCSSPGAVGVLLGKGHGIFAHPVSLSPDANNSVAVADVNGDGKPDLLVATNDATGMGAVGVLLNNTAIAPRTTKTVVSTSGSRSLVGQSVTFTAMVTSTHGAIPDGEQVTFYDGMTALASVTLSSGTAAYTTSSLSAKTHTIKATYAGDPTFKPSTGLVTQVVNKYPTTTSLTSSPNPSHSGQAVTFTAQVTSSGPAPTGKVKFLDGALAIGSATLSGGVAKLTKSTLAVGTHPITAEYLSDAFSAKSTSSVVNQVVQ
jgi:Big-like domain-containing protein/VCBS repeat protein/FG-GAP repeat protein